MPEIVKILVALATLAFGVYAFTQPDPTAKASHFALEDSAGRAELRTAFGGFFIGLGLACLIIGQDAAYQTLGLAYLITFVARFVALGVDGTEGVLRPEYMIFGAFELVSGILLYWPQ